MSEKINSNEDLQDILNDMDDVTEEKEVDVPLFQNMRIEKPFSDNSNSNVVYEKKATNTVKKSVTKSKDNEYTVIGNTTSVDSNITCGGNIRIDGQVKGKLTVSGSCDIYGSVEGDIEASEVVIENGAKVTGNVNSKTDLSVGSGSSLTGNVNAKNAYINSNVNGNIEVSAELKITSTGAVYGDITATNLSVASGALLVGRINIKR